MDRVFASINKSNTGYLSNNEFIDGLTTLFTETFDKLVKFIFDFYDYDKNGQINKEDVRIVLSYIPLTTISKVNSKTMPFEKYELTLMNFSVNFSERIESQEEIDMILEQAFGKSNTLSEKEFIKLTENLHSEIFLYVLNFSLTIFVDSYFFTREKTIFEKHNKRTC